MRSLLRTTVRRLAAVLVLVAAVSTAPASPLRAWRDGPVRALLTEEQYRNFGKLRTDSARKTFIERFWRDLDGDPAGPPGEFREVFERRCEAANARFATTEEEGWRTDRGRVYLLLGDPFSIEREPGDVHAIEREIWTYRAAAQEPETSLRIVFYRCEDGSTRLDPLCAIELDPTSVAYDDERADYFRRIRDTAPTNESSRVLAMIAELLAPLPGGLPSIHPVPGAPASTQTEASRRSPLVRTGAHPLESGAYFFRAADGTILTMLTLDLTVPPLSASGDAQPAGGPYQGAVTLGETARRAGDGPNAAPQTLPLEPSLADGIPGQAVFFGRAHLRAGSTYTARFAVRDPARDAIFVRNSVFGVPELSAGFQASSIVPAEQFGPAGPDSGRFSVGSEAVVPKPGGVFRRSELLRLYFQVYDAAIDPASSKARVDVVFRFYRTGTGVARRQGRPFSVRGATGASMGLALPIGDWPAGTYRVEVELRDRVAARRTGAEGRFSIIAD